MSRAPARLRRFSRGGGGVGRSRSGILARFMERALSRIAGREVTEGNRAELLVDGTSAYPVMLERIRNARHRIHFENYIIQDDAAGRLFAQALAERARAGVEVRVLYDWLGSFGTPNDYWRRLSEAGCEVRTFGRALSRRSAGLFARDHRKLLTVDGRWGVVGGLCIGDEWSGGTEEQRECWRDTAVLLDGPVTRELDRAFAYMWVRAGGDALPSLPRGVHVEPVGDVAVRVLDGRPHDARAYRLYHFISTVAERTLYVTMAYPLLPMTLRRSLAAAARAGVDVRMLVPTRSDLPLINQAARGRFGSLLSAGVRIYQWRGPMLHAKTVVADGRLAIVGSSNLEPWGLLGNYELDVEIQDEEFGGHLERQFMMDLERSEEIRYAEWRRRPFASRLRQKAASALLWLPVRLYGS